MEAGKVGLNEFIYRAARKLLGLGDVSGGRGDRRVAASARLGGSPASPRATAGVVRKRRHGNPRLLTSHAVYTLPYRLAVWPGGFFVFGHPHSGTNERGGVSILSQFVELPNLSTSRRELTCVSVALDWLCRELAPLGTFLVDNRSHTD